MAYFQLAYYHNNSFIPLLDDFLMEAYCTQGTYLIILDSEESIRLKDSPLEGELTCEGEGNGREKRIVLAVREMPTGDIEMEYDPVDTDWADTTKVSAGVSKNAYSQYMRESGITLRHEVGNLTIQLD